jgi:hypothetical protein
LLGAADERTRQLFLADAMEPADVAAAVLDAVRDERFFVFPDQRVLASWRAEADDADAWVQRMSDRFANLGAG